MADLSKLKNKKKNRFGTPPAETEISNNLSAPEAAPADSDQPAGKTARPARKTGRTEPFGTRVSPEFLKNFKRLAYEDDLKIVELLEKSLEAYENQRNN